ncbi:MAG TPA: ATP-binding cassette domain-containing protein [Deltaproteobacteria bacterium]|nr:ATP-binding cassette domain-containing protein [Deltaproteobacteria bacterium]
MSRAREDDALLRLVEASFGYDGRPIVRELSLEVVPGEFVALVGANGSGKSTLVRGLLGLLPPLRGRVERSPNLRIGYVPQSEALDPHYPLSGRDVTMMGATRDLPFWKPLDRATRVRTREALEATRATSFAGRRYGELSGGQRQRILIARALATDPNLLLLDEPTAGVDPATELAIVDMLNALRERDGISVWMVTHQLEAVRGRIDRTLELTEGGLRQEVAA